MTNPVSRWNPAERAVNTHWYRNVADSTESYAAAGFIRIDAKLISRPTPLPTGVTGWIKTLRFDLMNAEQISKDEQKAIAEGAQRRLKNLRQPDGSWVADYGRLRFTMRKPA